MIAPSRIWLLLALLLTLYSPVRSQAQQESRLQSEFRKEAAGLSNCKSFSSAGGCVQTLFTGQPLHIAVGSLSPQNGVGGGLAFVEHWHPENCPSWINFTAPGSKTTCRWRSNLNADAVATGNASWRAGAYLKAYRIPGGTTYRSAPVVNLYSQTTSLNRVYYYGLGPNTSPTAISAFGITQTIAGTQAILPFGGKTGIGLLAEANGRFVSLRGDHSGASPSIEQGFNDATAPGLSRQPAYAQFGEGVRFTPRIPGNYVRLNYLAQFQQFVAPSDSRNTFRRWIADLDHEFPLYRRSIPVQPNPENGPDSCSAGSDGPCPNVCLRLRETFSPSSRTGPPSPDCPPLPASISKEGSIDIRLLFNASVANAGHTVPFYFDPTLGGSDINGQPLLASYPDYRFRAPNLLLLRGTIEHSLGRLPMGVFFSVDEGKVGLHRDDISFDHLRHSYTTGLTLHAGGLPVVYLLFAWGGNEGHHVTANLTNALLGGSSRPSLF